jgi:hypothetical protein
MSKLKVYQAKNPTFGMGGHPEFNEQNFDLVAELTGDSLDDAFHLTNHIDRDWTKRIREGFTVVKKESRSTSVGDVVVKDGIPYRCENMGWKEIK